MKNLVCPFSHRLNTPTNYFAITLVLQDFTFAAKGHAVHAK
jgi:hypothetical protein